MELFGWVSFFFHGYSYLSNLKECINIFKLKHGIVPLSLAILATVYGASEAKAAEVTVKSQAEIDAALASITEDTTIKLDPTYSNETINMDINTTYNVTIDGNNKYLKGESDITDNSSGNITVKNILMDGKGEDQQGRDNIILNINVENGTGKFLIEKSKFKNARAPFEEIFESVGVLNIYGESGTVDVEETLFEKNSGGQSGGIYSVDSKVNINVDRSTFKGNESSNSANGAIMMNRTSNEVNVTNTNFYQNTSDPGDIVWYRGGAGIYFYKTKGNTKLNIKDSYFLENLTRSKTGYVENSSSAVTFQNLLTTDEVNITGTTFANNQGIGAGGAILLTKGDDGKNKINIENNTFYQNKVLEINKGGYYGGAIAIEDKRQNPLEQNNEVLTSRNNTYYDNHIYRVGDTGEGFGDKEEVKGGGIGIVDARGKYSFINDIIVGNKAHENKLPTTVFDNFYSSNGTIAQSKVFGYDNGIDTKDTSEQAFGKYPVSLAENGSKITAGRTEDAVVIPTVMIAPKLINTAGNTYTGFANMETSGAPDKDQRGFDRTGKQDIGAVEISSFVYDANGGKFTLPELTKYDGKTYYEGKDPIQYAKVDGPNSEYTILNGQSVLKPVRPNHKFLGWADVRNATKPDPKFDTGTKHTVVDQKTVYAVWESSKYTLKYHSNSKTSGVVPYQKAVDSSKEITIKPQGSMKRKSYKFKGWSTKPSAITADPKYAPGKKMKLTKKVSLYAVWRR